MGDCEVLVRLEYRSMSSILVFMKSKLLKTYIPVSWENIIIIVGLTINQACNSCWQLMNID